MVRRFDLRSNVQGIEMTLIATDIRFASPSELDAKALRTVFEILRLFREESPTIPVSYAMSFLTVALNPGGGATNYKDDIDVSQPIMSRILLALCGYERRNRELVDGDYGLLDMVVDPLDMRRKRTYLTLKGRSLADRIVAEIRKTAQ